MYSANSLGKEKVPPAETLSSYPFAWVGLIKLKGCIVSDASLYLYESHQSTLFVVGKGKIDAAQYNFVLELTAMQVSGGHQMMWSERYGKTILHTCHVIQVSLQGIQGAAENEKKEYP